MISSTPKLSSKLNLDGKLVNAKSKNFLTDLTISPFCSSFIDEYVSLIHAPTKNKKYMTSYTIKKLGNVVSWWKNGKTFKLPIERIKEYYHN